MDYAIVSSGNDDADQEFLRKAQVRGERLLAGICANGCGGMIETDANNAECPICHFVYHSSTGFNFKPAGRA
jgi:hypothetical protein